MKIDLIVLENKKPVCGKKEKKRKENQQKNQPTKKS